MKLQTFLLAALSTWAGTSTAQTLNWYTPPAPAPRASIGLAYDAATHSTLLFGGAGDNGATYGDTWIWLGGWHLLSPAASPSPRQGAGMAYDAAAGNIVLFGGCSNNGSTCTYLNDTWTWDGTTWTQRFPAVSPSPRVTNMAYDPVTKNVVLFGGTNSYSAGLLGDTWTWDGVSQTWTQLSPSTSPPARLGPLAYDPATASVVLFGGGIEHPPGGGGTAYGDTWNWNGTNWVQQFPASAPSARLGAALAYDPQIRALVLFGGAVGGDWENSSADSWTWNGSTWTQVHPATTPPNRYDFAMSYDPGEKAVLMFGGFSTADAQGGPWLLALTP